MGLSLAELEGRLSAALDESIMLSGQLQVASQLARDLAQDKERLENKVGIGGASRSLSCITLWPSVCQFPSCVGVGALASWDCVFCCDRPTPCLTASRFNCSKTSFIPCSWPLSTTASLCRGTISALLHRRGKPCRMEGEAATLILIVACQVLAAHLQDSATWCSTWRSRTGGDHLSGRRSTRSGTQPVQSHTTATAERRWGEKGVPRAPHRIVQQQ